MKIASIITFLLSIAPSTLSKPTRILTAEDVKRDLKRLNDKRAEYAANRKIANMHEVKYDDRLANDAMKNGDCKVLANQYLLIPDNTTFNTHIYENFDKRLDKEDIDSLIIGWTSMKRVQQALYDPRQSRIGCAAIKCSPTATRNKLYKFEFPYVCAVEHPVTDPEGFIKKGEPGSQCPKEKTKDNLCVGPPVSASESYSFNLALFIIIPLSMFNLI